MEASRIASVSAAVLVGFPSRVPGGTGEGRAAPGRVDRTDERCGAITLTARMTPIFEETLWVGDPPPDGLPVRHVVWREDRRNFVAGLAAAIAAAKGDRVIVVGEGDRTVSSELLLAFVAWPESAVVMTRDAAGGDPVPAIYRRDDLLSRAREVLASAESYARFESFVAGVEVAVVPSARLGLGDE